MFLRGHIYYGDCYFNGKRYRPSLRTGDPKVAKSRERVFVAFLEQHHIGPQEIPLWRDFKNWYWWYLEQNKSEGTIKIHRLAVRYLEEYRTPYYLRSITPDFLLNFKDFLNKKYSERHGAARNRYIKAIKSLMHTAERFGKIGIKQSWELIPKDEENENRLEFHDVEELRQIAAVLNGDLLTAFYLGWEEGLRRGEMVFLYKSDYNPHAHTITIRKKPEWRPKTKKSARTIFLRPDSEQAIKESISRAPASSPYIINLHGNRRQCSYLSADYRRETKRLLPHLHCYLHKLRHTFGSLLIQNGVHLKTVCDLMGHSNILQTEKYVHLGKAQYASAMNCLPKI